MKARPTTKGEGKTRTGVSGQGGDYFFRIEPGNFKHQKNNITRSMVAKNPGEIRGSVYLRIPGWGLNYLSPFYHSQLLSLQRYSSPTKSAQGNAKKGKYMRNRNHDITRQAG